MTKTFKNILAGSIFVFTGAVFFQTAASYSFFQEPQLQEPDDPDSSEIEVTPRAEGPQFKLKPDPEFPIGDMKPAEGIQLKSPSNLRSDVEYDPVTKQYVFINKVGEINYRRPSYMSDEEFREYEMRRTVREYWETQANGGRSKSQRGFRPSFSLGSEAMDRLLGSSAINIVPQGQAELIFKIDINTTENPIIPENLRTTTSFNFEEKIQMNVTGTIGERLRLGINYNTEATFEFENKTKLDYTGDEDDIIKKVEAGDVTLPLPGTLITGSQSLFGIKTDMQFGKLNVVTVLSQQKGQTQVVQVQGGAQVTEFEITADEYEANKHFLLSHYFKDKYNDAHATLPRIASNITITRIEVWVTNRKGDMKNARPVVGFIDLGEPNPTNMVNTKWTVPGQQFPENTANSLYNAIKNTVHSGNPISTADMPEAEYQHLQAARLLSENEYSVNNYLGYISLNSSLNADEILAVAYEYQVNGVTYKVGELASENQSKQPLVVKLIKGVNLSPRAKNWSLMMKNIYSLNAYEVSQEDFYLNIMYRHDAKGSDVNYIPHSEELSKIPLLKIMNLDKVNSQQQPYPDGVFDFIDRITIDKRFGRIIFPMLQPFGNHIKTYLGQKGYDTTTNTIKEFCYTELYDSTQTKARLVSEKNKYKLTGTYKSSSSSEIYLNAMNVPQGSVKVTSGGMPLTENQDYVVDYTLGSVKIINSAVMSSGQPIKVSLENNSAFAMQTKTLVGSHFNYKVSDEFNVGATILHLNERPMTAKVNIGDEPISNTIWGLNSTYRTQSQFLTTLVDKIPLIQTKETSNITLTGEFAQLIPGSSAAIGKKGVAYIDDFEASESSWSIKEITGWNLASTPNIPRFPEAATFNKLEYGFNRAKLAWYIIDPLFHSKKSNLTPDDVNNNPEWRFKHNAREVLEKEIFPNRYQSISQPSYLQVLNLSFYPQLRGPYNYDLNINEFGNLLDPQKRWGGIMKQIYQSDFEAANIEYIEFWMLDPFLEDPDNQGGEFYINLGDVSEDILKDGKMAFEQGLPGPGDNADYDSTAWGRVSSKLPLDRGFLNTPGIRAAQDVGLDGLKDNDERKHFAKFLESVRNILGENSIAYQQLYNDPSSDNFRYFKHPDYNGTDLDIVDRYIDYNGLENNSPEGSGTTNSNYSTPDMEDINNDNTLNDKESFYEYRISLKREDLVVGRNFIVDKVEPSVPNNEISARWFQFKVPVNHFTSRYGDIEDFKSIRFIRMYLHGFEVPVTVRFATLEFVRSEWRKYTGSLNQGGESISEQPSMGGFEVGSVNVEENKNYVLAPGVSREVDPSQPQYHALNEQSMVLKVTDLSDGAAKAVFKNANLDMRQYQRLKMYAHCRQLDNMLLNDNDVTVFIRIGSDNRNNYYEYEVPMKVWRDADGYKPETFWPNENAFDIELSKFQRLKQARNDANVSMQNPYQIFDGTNNRMTIVGNPSLSEIKSIMIGIRNPRDGGFSKSAEIWVNELRLTDFSDKGGWAANARAQFKLADFGNFRISGSSMQPNFGSIEKKVNDREKVETNQYDLATDLELGKFFPEKAQVKIPFYASYSKIEIRPQYNPLDPDIPLEAALDNARENGDLDRAEEIEENAIDQTVRRSISLTNVKVNKTSKTPMPYDPANFSVSLGYYDQIRNNYKTDDSLFHHEASLNYIFNNRPKNVAPFQRSPLFNPKPLRLIKDFNFYYSPTSISFRTNLVRDERRVQMKNLMSRDDSYKPLPTIESDFNWYRIYDVKYDLSRTLKVDFSAKNNAKIDQWNPTMGNLYQMNDSIKKVYDVWPNVKRGGRTVNYNQQINVTYTVPINKLPMLDWVTANARYGANFEWQYQPGVTTERNDSVFYTNYGNNVSNARTIQLNGNASLTTIYNKIGFLKDIQPNRQQGRGRQQAQNAQKEMKTVRYERTFFSLSSSAPRNISHNLGTENVTVKVTDSKGNEVKGTMEIKNINRIAFTPDTDVADVLVVVEGQVEAGPNPLLIIARTTARILTGVKTINVSFTQTDGTALPGYMPHTSILGSQYYGPHNQIAPGYRFILGSQNDQIITDFNEKNWLVPNNTALVGSLVQSNTQTLNVRINFEPFRGLRVDLTGNHSISKNKNSSYIYIDANTKATDIYLDRFSHPIHSGTFSMSVMSFGSFETLDSASKYRSKVFEKFLDSRNTMKERVIKKRETELYHQNVIDFNNHDGIDRNTQQVLIPTFLAIYGGYDLKEVETGLFPDYSFIRPNWRITYDGLTDIALVAEYFQSVTFNHSYSASYSVGSYISNPSYNDRVYVDGRRSSDGYSYVRSITESYVPQFDVSTVSITEQFSPWLGVDMTWKNNLTTRFEYKKNRMVSLGLTNYSINDMHGKEYVIGVGYRFPEMPLNMIIPGGIAGNVKSDLDLRADLSIRNNITVLRMIETSGESLQEDPTAGSGDITLKLSADYQLSDRLTVRLFFDRMLTEPVKSGSYKTINTSFGFSIRFMLAQ